MSADRDQAVGDPHDLDDLNALLGELRGERCSRTRFSYGDELRLDLGGMRPYRSGALENSQRGEWILGTRASAWQLSSPDGVVTSSANLPHDALTALASIEGSLVVDVQAAYPDLDLEVAFDNGYVLALVSDSEEHDIAAWELFTPALMVITAGPGRRWSYARADRAPDKPLSDKTG